MKRINSLIRDDLSQKLNLARLRWYFIKYDNQYTNSCIFGNPDQISHYRLLDVLTNIFRIHNISYNLISSQPQAITIEVIGKCILFINLQPNYITITSTKL